MKIAGIVKTSTIDFPGKLACVVFAAGCNYDCWYCHNRGLLASPPLLDEAELRYFLARRAGLLEGVVISGGEPTLQDDLLSFALELKRLGYAVKLDTNGSRPQKLSELLRLKTVDYVAIDYKAPLENYPSICKSAAGGVRECVDILKASDIDWEMRTTLIPQLDVDCLVTMAKRMPVLPHYFLQSYRPPQSGAPRPAYAPKYMDELAQRILEYQPNTSVRH